MLRTYAFTGRQKVIFVVLLTTYLGLLGIISWVISTQLIRPSQTFVFLGKGALLTLRITVTPMFLIQERTGCFAYSDQNTSDIASSISLPTSTKSVQVHPYHLGV